MSSEQQKIYDNAKKVGLLLSSKLPEPEIVGQIGDIVVSEFSLP
jgi:hypothetical protein